MNTEPTGGHIPVCFPAFVLPKTLSLRGQKSGLGRFWTNSGGFQVMDVIFHTRGNSETRERRVARSTEHQAILVDHLGLSLPDSLEIAEMS